MEYRRLGRSGLLVSALSFGAGSFGALGDTDAQKARRMIDISVDSGVTMFDTADVYSNGTSEEMLGEAIRGRRDRLLISTKASLPIGSNPNDAGSGRSRLITAVEASLRRLGIEYIDLFQLHAYDAGTPVEEVLATLDDLVRAGKIRYVGVSNFAGWQLMKSLTEADAHNRPRYVAHQIYYSLIGRDYEWELMPLGQDQGVGAIVWSPLGWARLTGQIRRGQPIPESSRLHVKAAPFPPVEDERVYTVVDALDKIVAETGKSIPQIALNWLLQRPTVATVLVGARNEKQLHENLGAIGWSLTDDQIARLDKASSVTPPYPYYIYYHQPASRLSPPIV
ncbi:aldo/keto reductase [Nocardia sp. NPDC051570]|uniref:aldo/keto reductase n=1 Tax=Nocardia sp. NPDC051570 TaxID=3364324 RepID=UPI003791B3D7